MPPHGISSGATVEAACGGLSDTVADLFGLATTPSHSNNTHSNSHHNQQGPLTLPSAEEVDLALDSLLNRCTPTLALLALLVSLPYICINNSTSMH